MKRRLELLVTQAYLMIVGAWPRTSAFAQGLPVPGPVGAPLPSPDGGHLIAPAIILVVALMGGLFLAVAVVDLRRKRRAQAIAIESQIGDALMREPRLAGTMVRTVAHLPLTGRTGPTVEVRGEVEHPELRETAVRIVRQQLLRYHPEGSIEDRIFVSPPIQVGRH